MDHRTGQPLPELAVNQALLAMGVVKIVRVEDDAYLIDVSWLHWNARPGTYQEKMLRLEEGLRGILPAGAHWSTV